MPALSAAADFIFDGLDAGDFEHLHLASDPEVGLRLVIAIHSTTLGPAAGGLRMWPYASEQEAIADALRLARAMTYKYAAAGVDLGGGAIYDADRLKKGGFVRRRALAHVDRIGDRMREVFAIGEAEGIGSLDAAYRMAERRLATFRRMRLR